jgi:hypothetical protein
VKNPGNHPQHKVKKFHLKLCESVALTEILFGKRGFPVCHLGRF